MAIVKIQAPLVGIRGKYGGMVFSGNGSGPYVRQLVSPVAKRTSVQVGQRAWMSEVRQLWTTLTDAQIADWNYLAAHPPELDYNSLNVQYFLSGAAWHMRVNLRRLKAGQAIDNICPAIATVTPAHTFGMTVYGFGYPLMTDLFSYTSGDFATGYAVLHIAVAPSGNSQVMTTGFKSVWCGTVVNPTWTGINAQLITAFGWLDVGTKLFGRLWHQSVTGIRSVALETSTVVLVGT